MEASEAKDASTTGGRVTGFDHVQVAIPRDGASEARARWFYGEVLGLPEIPKPAELVGRGGAWFGCGALALHVGLEAEHQPARKAHPAFLVTDLDAMRARLEAAGQSIHQDVRLPGYRRFETHDPFGNRLEFMQRIAPAVATGAERGQDDSASAIKDRVRAQFGRTAEAYVTSSGHAQGDDLARLVELAAPTPTDRALDIATGGGHTALALAPQVARVTASDLTPAMLAAARDHLTARGVANADFVLADAERLPFLDGTFDLVTVRIAPHHFANIQAACGEMARVLRPGGRLIVIDNVVPDDPALDTFVNEIEWRRDPSHVRCYTAAEWHAFLTEAGLTVTHTEIGHKAHDYADWTARSRMPAAARDALERDLLAAPPAVRDALSITEVDGRVTSWTSSFVILRAVKPA